MVDLVVRRRGGGGEACVRVVMLIRLIRLMKRLGDTKFLYYFSTILRHGIQYLGAGFRVCGSGDPS